MKTLCLSLSLSSSTSSTEEKASQKGSWRSARSNQRRKERSQSIIFNHEKLAATRTSAPKRKSVAEEQKVGEFNQSTSRESIKKKIHSESKTVILEGTRQSFRKQIQ